MQPLARPRSDADPDEEARFRARMERMSGGQAERPARRRRSGEDDGQPRGFRLGWAGWLVIDCLVVIAVVAAVVTWPPLRDCRHQESSVGFYAGDSVGKCFRRGVRERVAQADQRMKMLLRGSGH